MCRGARPLPIPPYPPTHLVQLCLEGKGLAAVALHDHRVQAIITVPAGGGGGGFAGHGCVGKGVQRVARKFGPGDGSGALPTQWPAAKPLLVRPACATVAACSTGMAVLSWPGSNAPGGRAGMCIVQAGSAGARQQLEQRHMLPASRALGIPPPPSRGPQQPLQPAGQHTTLHHTPLVSTRTRHTQCPPPPHPRALPGKRT